MLSDNVLKSPFKVSYRQVKTIMRCHQHLLKWLLSKTNEIANVGKGVERREALCPVAGNVH